MQYTAGGEQLIQSLRERTIQKMSMNDTPSSERLHIGFFGRRNAGKSSLVNAVTGQETALVSAVKGTTTDPVSKSMELLPLGPVVIIDTPGFDDEGSLGKQRVRRTRQVLNRTDLAVLVADGVEGLTDSDRELIGLFQEKEIPFIIAMNKEDLLTKREEQELAEKEKDLPIHFVSALQKTGIQELKEKIGQMSAKSTQTERLVGDLLRKGDLVLLVIPIDKAAPKGRLILPQQQTIRDILDAGCSAVCVRESELADLLGRTGLNPAMVITDSQVFDKVSKIVPEDIPLTSFSILMARYKGFLQTAVPGAAAVSRLKDGDRVLVSEGCTHHRQCGDIGTVKIPAWLKKCTGAKLKLEFTSGKGFPDDLSPYKMIIHCGGCMLNGREMQYRMKCAMDQGIPFTNYGTFIAYIHGILRRSIGIFPDLVKELDSQTAEENK
jgi:[FeFe] hydrogenase H-cluster maturation GTPase HydF